MQTVTVAEAKWKKILGQFQGKNISYNLVRSSLHLHLPAVLSTAANDPPQSLKGEKNVSNSNFSFFTTSMRVHISFTNLSMLVVTTAFGFAIARADDTIAPGI